MGKKKDHYEILGVPKAATAGDINEAYHKQSALKWKAAERGFDRLTTAHKVLSDPLRRPLYDKHLRAEEKLMGKAPPPAASSGVALGREVRSTGRKGAALGREVAGTGDRENTDRTGGGAKRACLRSSTGKAGGNGKRSRCLTDGATYAGPGGATGAHASTTFFSTGRSTFEMAVKYTNEYYNEKNCSSFDGEPLCPTDHSTFKMAVKYTNEYYNEENCLSFDGEPFCPTDHSTFKTAVKYTNEYYNEKNCSSFDGEPFCPTDHSTFKTAVKTMIEYNDEDAILGLCMYKEGVQDDYGDHAEAGNDDTRVCDDLFNGDDKEGGGQYAKYDDCGGGDHNYDDHGGAGNDGDTGVCDDYYDASAGGFDNGYYGGDAGDGADDWW